MEMRNYKKTEDKTSNEKTVDEKEVFECNELLIKIGELGRFQKYAIALLCLVSIPFSANTVGMAILAVTPNHWCKIPEMSGAPNLTFQESLDFAIPLVNSNGKTERSRCSIYARNYTPTTEQDVVTWTNGNSSRTEKCTSWSYENTGFKSIVQEWDLVCDRKWYAALSQSLWMTGFLIGCFIFGDLSDRYGRRYIMVVCSGIQLVFGIATAFAPNYSSFVALRLILAIATAGQKNCSYCMVIELCGPTWRARMGILQELFWCIGYILLGVISYATPNWTWLQLAIVVPWALLILTYKWLLPESPRWLLSKNRDAEAIEIYKRIAKCNGVELPESFDVVISRPVGKRIVCQGHHSVIDLVKTPNMRRRTLILWFTWFSISFGFFGLAFYTLNLPGDSVVNFIISGAVEMPSFLFCLFFINTLGRKPFLVGGLVVAGVACIASAFIPDSTYALSILLISTAMTGKFACSVAFGTVYVYTSELNPTVVRNIAVGCGSLFARMGGIVAPFISLLSDLIEPLPLVIFGVTSVAAGALSFTLPETNKRHLPDSIGDGELFGNDQKGLIPTCAKQAKQRRTENETGESTQV